ncbi:MAG: hypothetical protein ACYTHM_22070 [Planctomycetota bacterium]|jgi:hypothetical protein
MKPFAATRFLLGVFAASWILIFGTISIAAAGEEKPPEKPAPSEKKAGEDKKPAPAGKKPGEEKKPAPAGKKPGEEKKTAPAAKPGEKKPGPGTEKKKGESKGTEKAPKPTTRGLTVEEKKALVFHELRRMAVRQTILCSPLAGGHNNFFHSLVYIPPLRAGTGLPSETGEISLSFEATRLDWPQEEGVEVEANHFEGNLNVRYSLTRMVEFHSIVSGAILAGDVALQWQGEDMVPADREERFRLSRLVLGTKINLLPLGKKAPDIWLTLDFKIQGTDEELADSGRPGLAFGFLVTQSLGPFWTHWNIGWALSDGQENFPGVTNAATTQEEFIRVNRIFYWGLSIVWPLGTTVAVSVQAQGNTNGFTDLSGLSSDVHILSLGGRAVFQRFFTEVAGGLGLTTSSANYFLRLELGMLI